MSQTIDQVFSDYNVQGVPASGEKKPSKAEIRALLKMIQNSGGQAVTRNTLSALNGVTPPNENYMGIVLTGSGAGYYYRSGGAWVKGRGFPDSVARLTKTGGTVNAIQASLLAGVELSNVEICLYDADEPNTGPVTISINGGAQIPVKSVNGDDYAPGEFAGRIQFSNEGTHLRALTADADVTATTIAEATAYRRVRGQLASAGPKGASGLRGWAGSVAEIVPLVVDAVGKAILYFDVGKAAWKGRFDIGTDLKFWLANKLGNLLEGHRSSSGSGPLYPLWVDSSSRMLIYADTSTGKVAIPDLDTSVLSLSLGSARETSTKPLDAEFKLPNPTSSIRYGVFSYGQSLSIGAQGQEALSTTALFASALTFAAGPKTTLSGNGFGGQNQSAMDGTKALAEDDLSPDANNTRGETILSGMIWGAIEQSITENGLNPNSIKFFASACGKGGEAIQMLMKDALPDTSEIPGATENYYQNLIDHISQAAAISADDGEDLVVAAVTWMQGEGNAATSKSSYKSSLITLIEDIQSDVQSITGQEIPPHIIMYQQGSGLGSGENGPALAMYELSVERGDCWLGTPLYMVEPSSDGIHTINSEYYWIGRNFGRCLKSIIVDQQQPRQFRAVSARLSGSILRVRLAPPTLPLIIDDGWFGAVQDAGFKITSDAGVATISGVAVDGADVVISLSGTTPTTNIKVRYGLDYSPVSSPYGKLFNNGAGGNIRDSSTDMYRKGGVVRSIPFWLPSFEIEAYKVEG